MSAGVDGVKMTAVLQQPGYEEERLQRAAEQLPCREVQAGTLVSLMGEVGMLVSEIKAFKCQFSFPATYLKTYCPQICLVYITYLSMVITLSLKIAL